VLGDLLHRETLFIEGAGLGAADLRSPGVESDRARRRSSRRRSERSVPGEASGPADERIKALEVVAGRTGIVLSDAGSVRREQVAHLRRKV
jgi:hypothetical protein